MTSRNGNLIVISNLTSPKLITRPLPQSFRSLSHLSKWHHNKPNSSEPNLGITVYFFLPQIIPHLVLPILTTNQLYLENISWIRVHSSPGPGHHSLSLSWLKQPPIFSSCYQSCPWLPILHRAPRYNSYRNHLFKAYILWFWVHS